MARSSLVESADRILRDWIKSSKLRTGDRLPSERSLARELEIRHYAVNRAMAALAAEGSVERQGHKLFVAAPRSHEASLFCDVVVSRRSIYLSAYRKSGRDLGARSTFHLWDSIEEAVAILRQLNQPNTQGVIFAPPSDDSPGEWQAALQALTSNGIPTVCVGQQLPGVCAVRADNESALDKVFGHLLEMGHKEIAFVTRSPWAPSSAAIISQWEWLCQKYRLKNTMRRILKQTGSKSLPEDIRKLSARFSQEWKDVTALVVYTNNEYPVQSLLDGLAESGAAVPDRISLAFIGDSKTLQTATPSISATTVDVQLLHDSAFFLIRRAQIRRDTAGILPKPSTVRIQHELVVRESTGPSRDKAVGTVIKVSRGGSSTAAAPGSSPRLPALENALQKPYPFVAMAERDRFSSIDLGKYMNRPLHYRRGWLGDLPLKALPSGDHIIHGVPFRVTGGRDRHDCGSIVFASQVNSVGNLKSLPSSLRIPIGMNVSAVYILHGCGYSKYMHRFATYAFRGKRSLLGEIPLVSLGKPDPGLDAKRLEESVRQANIQDWWSDYPHYDFAHGRIAPLVERNVSEAVERHAFLYTLEWINPDPNKKLAYLDVTADTTQSTTLGILAVSVLCPSPRPVST